VGQGLPEERLRCCNTTVVAKQNIHSLALLIDGSIQVVPFASNGDVAPEPPAASHALTH